MNERGGQRGRKGLREGKREKKGFAGLPSSISALKVTRRFRLWQRTKRLSAHGPESQCPCSHSQPLACQESILYFLYTFCIFCFASSYAFLTLCSDISITHIRRAALLGAGAAAQNAPGTLPEKRASIPRIPRRENAPTALRARNPA